MGAPETGVPGLLPMCRGEFIITGDERGNEVAGEPGFGLIMAPGGNPREPDCG